MMDKNTIVVKKASGLAFRKYNAMQGDCWKKVPDHLRICCSCHSFAPLHLKLFEFAPFKEGATTQLTNGKL